MKGTYTKLNAIRREVFTEVARLAYFEDDYSSLDYLPYKILPGEKASYRDSIFLERAIVGERLRLAIGLPLRSFAEHSTISDGIEKSVIDSKYYEPPLVNIIKFACNACPTTKYMVSNGCQGCIAHPCMEVCPKKCISFKDGKSFINQDLCIKCGRCKAECPYDVILKLERPCEKACGVKAISTDADGKADIDYNKCVSCGMCLVNCPFGAIADKSQIFQLIQAIRRNEKVIAIMAPAFIGQFGAKVNNKNIGNALSKLGFYDTKMVAIGADLCTIAEANDFLENVPNKLDFMGTSCCPSWSVMAKKQFPEIKKNISMTLTPMVLSARMVKKEHPDAKVCFIGPCAAKKLEASRESVRSDVDFVLTFEELMGMFNAKEVDLNNLESKELDIESTAAGRGFAVSGGVADAVIKAIHRIDPNREVKTMKAEGLENCAKMLKDAINHKYDGYLLEGMACPFGCAGGAGTIETPKKTITFVGMHQRQAPKENAMDSKYHDIIEDLD